MRCIDADALRAEFKEPTDWIDSKQVLIHITGIWAVIDHAPTIEPESKTGKWLPTICNSDGMHHEWCGFHCSLCNQATVIRYKFCPNCGAHIRIKEEGGQDEQT